MSKIYPLLLIFITMLSHIRSIEMYSEMALEAESEAAVEVDAESGVEALSESFLQSEALAEANMVAQEE